MNLTRTARAVWEVISTSRPPAPYRGRQCQGAAWRRCYPNVPKEETRKFLLTFANAFAYREREKLQFRPDDAVFSIYRAHYPSRWTPDALELETFAVMLEKRYGLPLTKLWHETLTLGQIFEATRRQ